MQELFLHIISHALKHIFPDDLGQYFNIRFESEKIHRRTECFHLKEKNCNKYYIIG